MPRRLLVLTLSALLVHTPRAGAGDIPPPAHPRLGINLAGASDGSSELPFVDVFRFSRPWVSHRCRASRVMLRVMGASAG